MTVASEAGIDAAVEELTDADLRHSPPCESRYLRVWEFRKIRAFTRGGYDGHLCGKPSAARLRVHCRNCGARYRLFLCRWCAWRFRNGVLIACRACGREGKCRGTES